MLESKMILVTYFHLLGAAESFFILLFSHNLHNLKNALHPQSKLTKTYKSR